MKLSVTDMMKQRSPLARREAVTPVNLYDVPAKPIENQRPPEVKEVKKLKSSPAKPVRKNKLAVTNLKTFEGKRLLSLGDVARRINRSLRTVRYWTEEGLLIPVAVTKGGHLRYNNDSIKRCESILHLQEAKQLSIAELKRFFRRQDARRK